MKLGRLKFKGRHYSVRAFAAIGAGVISLIAYIVLSIISQNSHGNAGFEVGVVGMIMFILAIAGFITGLVSLREKDIFYGFSVAGISVSGISLLVYMISYILGLVS